MGKIMKKSKKKKNFTTSKLIKSYYRQSLPIRPESSPIYSVISPPKKISNFFPLKYIEEVKKFDLGSGYSGEFDVKFVDFCSVTRSGSYKFAKPVFSFQTSYRFSNRFSKPVSNRFSFQTGFQF